MMSNNTMNIIVGLLFAGALLGIWLQGHLKQKAQQRRREARIRRLEKIYRVTEPQDHFIFYYKGTPITFYPYKANFNLQVSGNLEMDIDGEKVTLTIEEEQRFYRNYFVWLDSVSQD